MIQPTDLFGEPLPAAVVRHKAAKRSIGYASRPGTGPKGQRCYSCKFAHRVAEAGRHAWKCEHRAAVWDRPESNIKPGAPSCREWERKPYVRREEAV